MRMFYCPKCNHLEFRKNNEGNPYEDELTIKNMLEWTMVPIQHYKCECGNYLAGYFEFVTQNDIDNNYSTDEGYESFHRLGDKQQEDNILFYQDVIANFNCGGIFYNKPCKGKTQEFDNLGDFAKWCYEDRKKRESDGSLSKDIFNPEKVISQIVSNDTDMKQQNKERKE